MTPKGPLRGIGEFFAQGILFRGARIVDDITHDEQLRLAVQRAYRLSALPDRAEVLLVLQLFREGSRQSLLSRPRGRRRTVDA